MTAAREIGGAARAWLDGLDDDQCARATFPFGASERFT